MENEVNHPNHYTGGAVECIDAIRASMNKDQFAAYCKGNVLKYLWRWDKKGGLEDLEKARVYLGWMVDTVREIQRETDEMIRRWAEAEAARKEQEAK